MKEVLTIDVPGDIAEIRVKMNGVSVVFKKYVNTSQREDGVVIESEKGAFTMFDKSDHLSVKTLR
jgi:hypothetical protein